MIEFIIYWWVLPTTISFVAFMGLLWHDSQGLGMFKGFKEEDWWILALVTIVWPLGFIMLVTLAIDHLTSE